MAGRDRTFPATRRNAVIAQFTASIQSSARKSALGQYLGTLQSELNGMTGEEASARIRQAIADMKAL